MADALSIALTGLMAQTRRLTATASNVANATTVGTLPTQESAASTVYKPLNVSFTALTAGSQPGGVAATITSNEDGYSSVYDPTSIYANEDGLVAAPDVDLAKEMVNLLETKALYKANLHVIKADKEMMGDLLDIVS